MSGREEIVFSVICCVCHHSSLSGLFSTLPLPSLPPLSLLTPLRGRKMSNCSLKLEDTWQIPSTSNIMPSSQLSQKPNVSNSACLKKFCPLLILLPKCWLPNDLNEDQAIRTPKSGKQDWGTAALVVKKCTDCSLVHTLEFYNYSKVKMQCTLAKRCSICSQFSAQDKLP